MYAKNFPEKWCEKFDQPQFAEFKPKPVENSDAAKEEEYYLYHTAMKIITDGPNFEESEELQVLVGSLDDDTEIFK